MGVGFGGSGVGSGGSGVGFGGSGVDPEPVPPGLLPVPVPACSPGWLASWPTCCASLSWVVGAASPAAISEAEPGAAVAEGSGRLRRVRA